MPAPAIKTLEAAGFADARAHMTRVFAKVPFIQSIDDDAFSIHDLFREFVATQASRDRAIRGDAAARMGTALVAGGNPADGLRLLIEAENVEGVVQALGRHAFNLLETGQRSIVTSAVAFLSERGLEDSGIVLAIRGALAFADGSASNSANLFVRALEREVPPAVRSEVTRRLATGYANRGKMKEALEALRRIDSDDSISLEDRLDVRALTTSFLASSGGLERAEISAAIAEIEAQIPNVQPSVQARLLQRLGVASFYISDSEKCERFSQDAALLARELGMDTLAAMAYATLYSLAAMVDGDAVRARSFSRSQAAAAERAANTALNVYALRAEYIFALHDVDLDAVRGLETALTALVDTHAYRDAFHFRLAQSVQYLAINELSKAEATMRSMPLAALSIEERARYEALLLLITLLRSKRSEVAVVLERGLLREAPSGLMGRIEMAHAYAYRGIAYWLLGRPAQARK
jgi:hypothetical protein